jgi:hypothetical protein
MKLVRTQDSEAYCWIMGGKTIWCSSMSEVYAVGWYHVAPIRGISERCDFMLEVDRAIEYMMYAGHFTAKFGVLGSFMFTEEDEAAYVA